MNIIILSTSDSGGAGKFSYRLHKSFIKRGLNSHLLVKENNIKEKEITQVSKPFIINVIYDIIEYLLEFYLPQYKTNSKYYFFNRFESFTKYPSRYILDSIPYPPDIILVGWVSGFINFKTLYKLQKKTGARIVFYFTDMGIMTGGCHYDMFCNGYTNDCKNCPAILNHLSSRKAHKNLYKKKEYLDKMNINIFPGTKTLEEQTKKSYLFKDTALFECTNAPINQNVFNNNLRDIAKRILGISSDKKTILIGATNINDERKGFRYLLEALDILSKTHSHISANILILVIGGYLSDDSKKALQKYELKYLETIQDDRLLSITYQASDLFICPSVYDSGPLMVMESLMCGTPVVAFKVGVSNDLVVNGYTGYKAENFVSADIAHGIYSIFNLSNTEYHQMRNNCIENTAKHCSEEVVLNKILKNIRILF